MLAIEDVVIKATAKQIEDMATRSITNEISEDSTQDELPSAAAVYNALQNGGGAGGGVAPLIVTIDATTGKASHTSTEILSHIRQGGLSVIDNLGFYLQIAGISEMEVVASVVQQNRSLSVVIDSDGNYVAYDTEFATSDQVGDISSALDELHTYAQRLISGGAAE